MAYNKTIQDIARERLAKLAPSSAVELPGGGKQTTDNEDFVMMKRYTPHQIKSLDSRRLNEMKSMRLMEPYPANNLGTHEDVALEKRSHFPTQEVDTRLLSKIQKSLQPMEPYRVDEEPLEEEYLAGQSLMNGQSRVK